VLGLGLSRPKPIPPTSRPGLDHYISDKRILRNKNSPEFERILFHFATTSGTTDLPTNRV